MKSGVLPFAAIAAIAGLGQASAAQYLPGVPLVNVLSVQARDCSAQTSWRMPIITWGADEVTLAANGDALATKPNSVIGKRGLDVRLKRVDDYSEQVRSYLTCDSPFLRATLGMVAQAADLTEADPRTKGVVVYQHSWSAGGDVMVARADVRQPKDLKGKVIVLQRFGPHVDYLLRILSDAGLKPSDVTIKYVKDITGKDDKETPAAAMLSDDNVAAVMVISTDAATLTSGGGNSVGTGAEGSRKGAHELLSSRTLNRFITDVIVVRQDFYDANKDKVAAFGKAMYETSDRLKGDFQGRTPAWKDLMKFSAGALLDDPGAQEDAQGLWTDAEISDRQGNARFFADVNYPRSFDNVSREVSSFLRAAGLTNGSYRLHPADWDWQAQTSVADVAAVAAPKFDAAAANRVVTSITGQGKQGDDTLYEFPIHFQNGQKDFPRALYGADFDKVIDLASTYSGAVITVEGHVDPQAYLHVADPLKTNPADKDPAHPTAAQIAAAQPDPIKLFRTAQSGRNLSIARANQVVAAVIDAAKAKGVILDPSQFVAQGLGYDRPTTGMCGQLPCRPKNEQDAQSNRVVNFRVLNVEAETDAFAAAK
jgi:ABC-type nitrate/sulfonate/bicarbonate transport system substrate-binding protein